jgi:uncharacterized SAM-binding protein YcdF (DUF218 family)
VMIVAAIFCFTLWSVVAWTSLARHWAHAIMRADPLQDADAIYVLGSRVQTDEEFTTDAMQRLLRGIELAQQKRAPRIVLSEVWPPAWSYERAARRELDALGVKTELLSIGLVRDTHDEAVAFGRMAREHGWHRVIVVTSPTHCRRSALAFEHEGLQVIAQPSMETRYDLPRLPNADDRVAAFGSLMHETVGVWIYRARGWVD